MFNINGTTNTSGIALAKDSKAVSKTSVEKLENMARHFLTEGVALKPSQKLFLGGYSRDLSLMHKINELAYKEFKSGRVRLDIKEPSIEALKKTDGLRDFDYKASAKEKFLRAGAKKIELGNINNEAYRPFNFTDSEIEALRESIRDEISPEAAQYLEIDPSEILDTVFDYRPKQSLLISGTREHLPQMVALAKEALKRGTQQVDFKIGENSMYMPSIPLIKYASQATVDDFGDEKVKAYEEYLEKGTIRMFFEGDDPYSLDALTADEKTRLQDLTAKVTKPIMPAAMQVGQKNPWCVYYSPTPVSAKAAGYTSFVEAAKEAQVINRTGKLEEHIARMFPITDKLNSFVKQGYKELRFVSVKPGTPEPDGQTDLTVRLTDKSKFISVGERTPSGQRYIPNIPSEESFTTPDWRYTNGKVKSTRPVNVNGSLVEGAEFVFKDGKLLRSKADKNDHVLQGWLTKLEDVDKLGEVALVAGSPIFDTGRVFNSILLDENATCHIAFGSCYPECVEGAMDLDPIAQAKYVKDLGGNLDATGHTDFMIGGPNVMVYAQKPDQPDDKVLLVKDNKFQFDLSS